MQKDKRTITPIQLRPRKLISRKIIRPAFSSMNLTMLDSTELASLKFEPKRKTSKKKLLKKSKSPALKASQSYSMKLPGLSQTSVITTKSKKIVRSIFKQNFLSPNLLSPLQAIDMKKKCSKLEYSSITKIGSTDGREKSQNQDSFIVFPSIPNSVPVSLFCVLDGHGPNGHIVSQFLESQYVIFLQKYLPSFTSGLPESSSSYLFKELISELECALYESQINILYSGSTLISVLLFENYCICTSIGDSRAIIGEFEKTWTCKALNKEHKPGDPEERKRIEEYGGRVGSMKDNNGKPVGPVRAWGSSQNSPGLAMSRTIGDSFSANFGVISDPGK